MPKECATRHDHVPDHHEPVTPPDLLQNPQEHAASRARCQQRPAAIAAGGDEVQMLAAVIAAQALGHTLSLDEAAMLAGTK